MNDILNKSIVLVLNRNWQAINIRTPQEAFCMMAANVATGLDIELANGARAEALRPVTWDEWITLPVRSQDSAVLTMRGPIRVPTVIVALNYAKVPKKRPKLISAVQYLMKYCNCLKPEPQPPRKNAIVSSGG